ncbi:hypothetical protein [Capnocytophaga canimorsus]|uniref:hypothetical protein n=1 Tax=Capnocytophaga canimorsus TaxID=28188 RepID=UPI001AD09BE2|nr:hypothetical protein [Capnocytophaga canimorsus]GIM58482.1 hypothetical protein CAPN007_06890 [Capnocytophaga canimorsus]
MKQEYYQKSITNEINEMQQHQSNLFALLETQTDTLTNEEKEAFYKRLDFERQMIKSKADGVINNSKLMQSELDLQQSTQEAQAQESKLQALQEAQKTAFDISDFPNFEVTKYSNTNVSKYAKLEFQNYTDLISKITNIIEVCRVALLNDTEKVHGFDVADTLEVVRGLIPYEEFNLLDHLHAQAIQNLK